MALCAAFAALRLMSSAAHRPRDSVLDHRVPQPFAECHVSDDRWRPLFQCAVDPLRWPLQLQRRQQEAIPEDAYAALRGGEEACADLRGLEELSRRSPSLATQGVRQRQQLWGEHLCADAERLLPGTWLPRSASWDSLLDGRG
eukprot:scaffold447_cov307-Pinguiococcus_pyrenoidosus.AAC.47